MTSPFYNLQGILASVPAQIPLNGTTSAAVALNGFTLVGIQMPATFTGTSITFKASQTLGGTYGVVKNASGTVTYPASAGEYLAINPTDFYGVVFLEIVSNATELQVDNLTLLVKGF